MSSPQMSPRVTLIRDHLLVMSSQRVWVSSSTEGFVAGEITDLGSDRVTVSLRENNKTVTKDVPYDCVFPAEEDDRTDYDDNCSLMFLNEATLLHNVKVRFSKGNIYSYIANMLIAVNPYVTINGLYDDGAIKRYQGKSLGTLPPHVYAIADKTFRDMKVTKTSQSIIVSGESGAGKTESTKYILRYLCGSYGAQAGLIEHRILDANPILEAFGNAKTTRNNNSSRFGKFIEIHFESGQQPKVAGGFISHYLLEKSRIVMQSPQERNYHIFYELLKGLSPAEKTPLGLEGKTPSNFTYLKSGCCEFFGDTLRDPIVHDAKDFQNLQKSFKNLGITQTQEIFKIVAIVLHLGNINFVDDVELTSKGGCRIDDPVSDATIDLLCELMKLEKSSFTQALTSRVMQTAKGGSKGTVIMVPLKKHEAVNARDALAKSIYNRLFDWIVARINDSIPLSKNKTTYIGVLDIAGFEYFTVNSFEQFCINYCNEKLQQFFNERVLHDEQDLYAKEQLHVKKIEYVDNSDCIELIEGRPMGILPLLDEESKLPKPLATHFTAEVHSRLATHFRLVLPRKSKIKEHRDLLDDQGFIIRHFAGAVCYETRAFLDKNNDALHFSLEVLVQESGNGFLKNLFGSIDGYRGKLSFVSVAGKFKTQLGELLEKLRSTGTSFVRCVKPNSKMVQGLFEGAMILSQLQCAGMTSVLELMQRGFPSRVAFLSLYNAYSSLLPPRLSSLDPRFFCRALFKALGLSEEDFKFGLTRVFFRPGKFKEFDQLMRNDPESLVAMVAKVQRWIVVSRWKKFIFSVLSTIKLKNKILFRRGHLVVIQKTVRMHLARKQHRPRYRGMRVLTALLKQTDAMQETAKKLKKDQTASVQQVNQLANDIAAAKRNIKTNVKMGEREIESQYKSLLTKTDTLVKLLSDRVAAEKNAEEQERARKMREEMERQIKEKQMQEDAKKLEEENKKKKQELEERRKREVAAAPKPELRAATEENNNNQQEYEQDKRDTEMALRLAREANATPDETQTGLKRSNYAVAASKNKKHDLSAWKYSELRDTINTSCDVELLNACREEFHRRLKVYHAWKARNTSKTTATASSSSATSSTLSSSKDECERAPKSVYQYQQSYKQSAQAQQQIDPHASRFFRIPFTKDGMNKGLWYAHFTGEFIQRQMEVHGGGTHATLLVAGRDDMQMCELKLSETGLTRKRGAEILEYEFDKEWNKHSSATPTIT